MSDAIAGPREDTAGEPVPGADRARSEAEHVITGVEAEGTAAAPEPEPADADAIGAAANEPDDASPEPGTVDPAAIEDSPQEAATERLDRSPEAEVPVAEGGAAVVGIAPNAPITAVDAALASATPLAAAVARSAGRQRVQLRSSVTLGLFAVGLVVGAIAWRLINVAPSAVEAFPALPLTGEPPVAAVVAQHLAANDAQALSDSLNQEVLDAIREQLSPLQTLERVTFVNAASLNDQILAAYVVEGSDDTGARGIVGLILVVRDGAVVAQ